MPRKELPVERIVERYTNGETTYELGKAYCVGRMTIWRRLVDAGVVLRRWGHTLGGPLHDNGDGRLRTKGRDGRGCLIHRGCYEAVNGTIPDGYVVHHVDGDNTNNSIENLVAMTRGEHVRLHKMAGGGIGV